MSQDADQPSPAVSDPAPAEEAFSEFYRSYRAQLLRFVHRAGHRDGLSEAHLDAEGVVQETFEAAFRVWATIEHPERWIYRVAGRKVRQHSHQEWYRDRELRRNLEMVYSEKSGMNTAHIHAVAGDIINLIMKLPTNQRIATYLSGVLEWTGPEIAEALDIAPATAYVHVTRGIKAIRSNGYEGGHVAQMGATDRSIRYTYRDDYAYRMEPPMVSGSARKWVRRVSQLLVVLAMVVWWWWWITRG